MRSSSVNWLFKVGEAVIRKEFVLFGLPLLGFIIASLLLVAQHEGLALKVITASYLIMLVATIYKFISHGKG